jgi:hypothetical protein
VAGDLEPSSTSSARQLALIGQETTDRREWSLPRGWVIVTLASASWGAMGLLVWAVYALAAAAGG